MNLATFIGIVHGHRRPDDRIHHRGRKPGEPPPALPHHHHIRRHLRRPLPPVRHGRRALHPQAHRLGPADAPDQGEGPGPPLRGPRREVAARRPSLPRGGHAVHRRRKRTRCSRRACATSSTAPTRRPCGSSSRTTSPYSRSTASTRPRSSSAAGGYSPTMGIIGTVLGLTIVLKNLSEPDKLGSPHRRRLHRHPHRHPLGQLGLPAPGRQAQARPRQGEEHEGDDHRRRPRDPAGREPQARRRQARGLRVREGARAPSSPSTRNRQDGAEGTGQAQAEEGPSRSRRRS